MYTSEAGLSAYNRKGEITMGIVIAYNSSLSGLVGGINAAVMMSQLEYWFKVMKGKVFYKFLAPCEHEHYKEGDSWIEELGISISEARYAFRKIGVVYKSKRAFMESKDKFQGKLYASYYDRIRKKTYYYRNDEAVKGLLEQAQSGKSNQSKELDKACKTEDGELKRGKVVKVENPCNGNEKTASRLNKDYYKEINTDITAKREIETDKLISINKHLSVSDIQMEMNKKTDDTKTAEDNLNQDNCSTHNGISGEQVYNDAPSSKMDYSTWNSETHNKALSSKRHEDTLTYGAYDEISDEHVEDEGTDEDIHNNTSGDKACNDNLDKLDDAQIVQLYNEHLGDLLGVKEALDAKEQQLAEELYHRHELTLEDLEQAFRKVAASRFLCGKTAKSTWRASLPWIFKMENLNKVIAGNYDEPEWSNSYREHSQNKLAVSEKVNRFNQMESHSWDFDEIELLEMRLIDQRIKEMNEQGQA